MKRAGRHLKAVRLFMIVFQALDRFGGITEGARIGKFRRLSSVVRSWAERRGARRRV